MWSLRERSCAASRLRNFSRKVSQPLWGMLPCFFAFTIPDDLLEERKQRMRNLLESRSPASFCLQSVNEIAWCRTSSLVLCRKWQLPKQIYPKIRHEAVSKVRHRMAVPTGYATRCKQTSDEVRKGDHRGWWKQTEASGPHDRLRGEMTSIIEQVF